MFRLVKECRPTWVIGENVSGHIKLGLDTVLEDLESEGYSTRAFSISASSIGANHKRERVWVVGHSQHNGSSSSTKRRSFEETSNNNQERKNEAGELAGAGRSNGGADVENTRRTLRQGSFFGEENENETGQEDAYQFERSSSSSGNGISNTDSQRLQGLGAERELRESQEERSFGWERWWKFEPNVGRVAHGIPKRVDRLKGLGNSLVPAIPFIIGNSILETEENNERI